MNGIPAASLTSHTTALASAAALNDIEGLIAYKNHQAFGPNKNSHFHPAKNLQCLRLTPRGNVGSNHSTVTELRRGSL